MHTTAHTPCPPGVAWTDTLQTSAESYATSQPHHLDLDMVGLSIQYGVHKVPHWPLLLFSDQQPIAAKPGPEGTSDLSADADLPDAVQVRWVKQGVHTECGGRCTHNCRKKTMPPCTSTCLCNLVLLPLPPFTLLCCVGENFRHLRSTVYARSPISFQQGGLQLRKVACFPPLTHNSQGTELACVRAPGTTTCTHLKPAYSTHGVPLHAGTEVSGCSLARSPVDGELEDLLMLDSVRCAQFPSVYHTSYNKLRMILIRRSASYPSRSAPPGTENTRGKH